MAGRTTVLGKHPQMGSGGLRWVPGSGARRSQLSHGAGAGRSLRRLFDPHPLRLGESRRRPTALVSLAAGWSVLGPLIISCVRASRAQLGTPQVDAVEGGGVDLDLEIDVKASMLDADQDL